MPNCSSRWRQSPFLTSDEARELALALLEAAEEDHHGRSSFRVSGKIFATLRDERHMNVMLDEGGVLQAVQEHPDACEEVFRALDYPVVIIDAPPLLYAPEAIVLCRIADDTLVTVRAGVTRERDVRQALEVLRRQRTPASGIILNDHRDVLRGLRIDRRAVSPVAQSQGSAARREPMDKSTSELALDAQRGLI